MTRRHGFVCPWGPHQVYRTVQPALPHKKCIEPFRPVKPVVTTIMQVLALMLYVYLLLAFYILTAPFLPSSASHITFQVLYGVVAAATLVVGVMATYGPQFNLFLRTRSHVICSFQMFTHFALFAVQQIPQTQDSRIILWERSQQATGAAFVR